MRFLLLLFLPLCSSTVFDKYIAASAERRSSRLRSLSATLARTHAFSAVATLQNGTVLTEEQARRLMLANPDGKKVKKKVVTKGHTFVPTVNAKLSNNVRRNDSLKKVDVAEGKDNSSVISSHDGGGLGDGRHEMKHAKPEEKEEMEGLQKGHQQAKPEHDKLAQVITSTSLFGNSKAVPLALLCTVLWLLYSIIRWYGFFGFSSQRRARKIRKRLSRKDMHV